MRGLQALKPLPGVKPAKADLSRMPMFPTGPERFSTLKRPPDYKGGPQEPPAGFVVSGTSRTEWWFYWACCVVFGTPTVAQHRNPPYEGMHGFWSFQHNVRNILGHSFAADFVFWPSSLNLRGIAVRIQTEHFHYFAPSVTQEFDRRQRQGVQASFRVIDIPDYMFIRDPTGQAAIRMLKLALAGIEPSATPNTTRHALKSRQR